MPLSPLDQSRSDKFFAQIEPVEKAYRKPTFRFIALLCDEEWVLFYGVLGLGTDLRPSVARFESQHIYAGEMPLSAIAATPKQFVDELLSGGLQLDDRKCLFPADPLGNYQAHNWDFDGYTNKRDQAARLSFSGASNYYRFAQEPWIRRELITSHLALESLAELAAHYRMEFGLNIDPRAEIHASAVGAISESSSLGSNWLHLELTIPGMLDAKLFALTARARCKNGQGRPLTQILPEWAGGGEADWKGAVDIKIEDAVDVTCNLITGGFLQQRLVISEPAALRDSLRFAYEVFAPDTASFAKVIDDDIKNRSGSELEYTVSAMLSLMGYRSFSIDHLPALGETPDIVAVDPRGNILLVECTLKLPNASDKMSKLAERHEAVQSALKKSGRGHLHVLAILACAWPNERVAPFVRDAVKAGLLLWGQDDMHRWRNALGETTAESFFDAVSDELGLQGQLADLSG